MRLRCALHFWLTAPALMDSELTYQTPDDPVKFATHYFAQLEQASLLSTIGIGTRLVKKANRMGLGDSLWGARDQSAYGVKEILSRLSCAGCFSLRLSKPAEVLPARVLHAGDAPALSKEDEADLKNIVKIQARVRGKKTRAGFRARFDSPGDKTKVQD